MPKGERHYVWKEELLMLVQISGKHRTISFTAGIVLKELEQNELYEIIKIAPILNQYFYKSVPISLSMIQQKCQANDWELWVSEPKKDIRWQRARKTPGLQ
jgi:hypothetical protein